MKSSNTENKPLIPPPAFGIVEQGLYRSSIPYKEHFRFLRTLNLKTIISLCQEIPSKPVTVFCTSHNINFVK